VRSVRLTLIATVAMSSVALALISAAGANPDIDAKKAEAQRVYNEYLNLAMEAEHVGEEVNGARVQLASIESDLDSNARHLEVARQSLEIARTRVGDRLRAIYMEGEPGGAVEVILGAESLDDLLNRIDMVQRVGALDSRVVDDVARFRSEVVDRRGKLTSDRQEQKRLLAEIQSKEREAQRRRDAAQRLYESKKDEIVRLQAEEARRAAAAAAEARRLAAEAEAARARAIAESAAQPSSPEAALPALPSFDPFPPAPDSRYGGVVGIAMQYLGVPYVWGGMSPSGFDCSGLIAFAYAQVGVSLPHHAASQYNYGTPVSRDALQAGDLVFFDGLGHAGIYAGGGNFIHAPHSGDVVKISSLYQDWYSSKWVGARRMT
jgi:peptidoglycan DL-endopeptidase CwlO